MQNLSLFSSRPHGRLKCGESGGVETVRQAAAPTRPRLRTSPLRFLAETNTPKCFYYNDLAELIPRRFVAARLSLQIRRQRGPSGSSVQSVPIWRRHVDSWCQISGKNYTQGRGDTRAEVVDPWSPYMVGLAFVIATPTRRVRAAGLRTPVGRGRSALLASKKVYLSWRDAVKSAIRVRLSDAPFLTPTTSVPGDLK